MQLSDGEKLISFLLAARHGKHRVEKMAAFIAEAIVSGHVWAIERKYPGIFSTKEVSEDVQNEVFNFLDMWLAIENASRDLFDEAVDIGFDQRLRLDTVQFQGFIFPDESEHLFAADFIINNFDRYDTFKGRDFDARSPRLEGYRRMWPVFEQLRAGLGEGAKLNAGQLGLVLKEIVHPDNRQRDDETIEAFEARVEAAAVTA
jgi:uncharacterized protein